MNETHVIKSASLSVESATLRAGGRPILDGLQFTLFPGELCALIGPSGAGKSTLIKALLSIKRLDKGSIRLGDKPIAQSHIPIGYVPQYDQLHETLSLRRSLFYSAKLRLPNLGDTELNTAIDAVAQQVGLQDRLDLKIKKLSGGQKKRVSVALELLTSPPILILDEPTSGLDPGMERQMSRLFQNLARRGRILLVATHAMESLSLYDHVMVLMDGKLIYFGPPEKSLPYFRSDRYAQIFSQLPKRSASAWHNAWLKSPELRDSHARPQPQITQRASEQTSRQALKSPKSNPAGPPSQKASDISQSTANQAPKADVMEPNLDKKVDDSAPNPGGNTGHRSDAMAKLAALKAARNRDDAHEK